MTFSSTVKEELCKLNNYKNVNTLEAELLGYLLTENSVESSDFIEFVTENEFNIESVYRILFALNIEYEPDIRGKCYVAKIKKNEKLIDIMNLKIDSEEEVQRNIVKGAFLGAGSIIDPNKQYHLEMLFSQKNNAEYILNICKMYGVNLKILESEKDIMLYIKESDEISKFLALIGANKAVLNFEDIRLTKEVKNNVNRRVNCETSNLNKIVNASVTQINDIKLIQKLKKFDELPDYLKEISVVRIENPHASLKMLGEMLDKPIGKSGVNHRLQKIHEIAEDLRNTK